MNQVWANPTKDATPAIHFPTSDQPMARMTENTNLQRALLRRIDEVGQGIVTIREGGRVAEMRLGEGGRWVGLRIGEADWVRGSVVVSEKQSLLYISPTWLNAIGRSGWAQLASQTLLRHRISRTRVRDPWSSRDASAQCQRLVP
jgi:hypothetical protein